MKNDSQATPKRAVIFARTRSIPADPERDYDHLAMQIDQGQKVAAQLSAQVVHVYSVVGGTTEPVVQQVREEMLRAVESDDIDCIITSNGDRLTRQLAGMVAIQNRLDLTNTSLIVSPLCSPEKEEGYSI